MSRTDYNWTEDPWNEEKQAEDAEELRHAKRMGLIVAVVVGILLFIGVVTLPLLVTIIAALTGAALL